jgi:hypothetical protein
LLVVGRLLVDLWGYGMPRSDSDLDEKKIDSKTRVLQLKYRFLDVAELGLLHCSTVHALLISKSKIRDNSGIP